MQTNSHKIAISVGELSGDQHAAKLVKAIKQELPGAQFKGMAGTELRAEGVEAILKQEKYGSINGFNIPKILIFGLISYIRMILFLLRWRPKALILVDYPDFNLRLAKIAKLLNIKTLYFIPPKIWAWRSGRIKLFKKYIDQVYCIFPFEQEFFEKEEYQHVEYVGHPFTDELSEAKGLHFKNREAFLRSLGLVPTFPTAAVLLGSRNSEIKRHLTTTLKALELLKQDIEDLQAIISIAPNIKEKKIARAFKRHDWIKVTQRDSKEVMKNSDVGILKSGTCNLEAAFLDLPFICIYKGSAPGSWIVNKFVKIKEYSLVNIVKPQSIKELIQQNASPERIAEETKRLIFDKDYRAQVLDNFKIVRDRLTTLKDEEATTSYGFTAKKLANKVDSTSTKHGSLLRLLGFLRSYAKIFALAMFCMVLFGATDGALPLLVKHFLDGVFASKDQTMLYVLPMLIVVLACFRAVTGFAQEFLMQKIGHNVVKDIRNSLHDHLLKVSPSYFMGNSAGNILARFTSDVLLVKTFLTDCLSAVIRDSIRIIALVCVAVYLDPVLALIALIAFPIAIIPIYSFGRKIRKLSKRGQDEIGSISSLIQETVAGSRVIRLFNRERFEQEKFDKSNQDLTKTFVKSEKVRALSNPVNEVLAAFAICGVILYGGHTVLGGARSQGDFIAFLISVFLLYDPFKKLSRVYHQLQQGLSGAERIFEVLDEESDIKESNKPQRLADDVTIKFDNVTFQYASNKQAALNNVNLTIKTGQKLALVGFSGAGKSTLVDLLPRFIDPSEGQVSIGGIDIKDLSIANLRQNIAMVNQHTFLFNDTIYNNIAYGKVNTTKEEIEGVAKAAYIHDFIMTLPEKYETLVGEGGFSLSGGERQRIAIARAILKDAPILILDEATASLDNHAEKEVQMALEKLESGRTSIIIAHRLSTVRSADMIVVMNEGQVVEVGTHSDLLSNSGIYSKLHSLQFQDSAA